MPRGGRISKQPGYIDTTARILGEVENADPQLDRLASRPTIAPHE